MNQTITEKIFSFHAQKDVFADDIITSTIDMIIGNDITTPISIRAFEQSGASKIANPDNFCIVMDHFIPAKDIASANQAKISRQFAKKHNLHIVYVADLVKYRMQNESLVNIVKNIKNSFLLEHKTTKIEFEDHNKNIHIVYQFGKLSETMAVKFHIIGRDIEFIEDSSRFDSFLKSVDYLSKNSGILLFLDTNNTNNKTVNAQTNIGIGALILNKLGIKEIELLTLSTKRHEFIGIKGFSLKIIKEIQI